MLTPDEKESKTLELAEYVKDVNTFLEKKRIKINYNLICYQYYFMNEFSVEDAVDLIIKEHKNSKL